MGVPSPHLGYVPLATNQPKIAHLFLLFYQVRDQVPPLDATFDRQVLPGSDIALSCNCVYHNYVKLSTDGDLRKPGPLRRCARRQTGASLPVMAGLVQAGSGDLRTLGRGPECPSSSFHRWVRLGAYHEDWACDTAADTGAFGER